MATTELTEEATLIQSRHRIPEVPLRSHQVLVLQVPTPEPLRFVEPREEVTRRLHAEKEYTGAWLMLFEEIMRHGAMTGGSDHPVSVHDRYVMAPSPIPRFDNPKMDRSEALILLGAGREKKIYAVPPYSGLSRWHSMITRSLSSAPRQTDARAAARAACTSTR